ncbi:MAG: carboxypeptidase regulatory-like domain-containing protein [Xanthobacteraceae bacterium]
MRKYLLWLIACAGLAMPSLLSGSVAAQNNLAMTGVVTSAEEGAMEGVLVNAKKGIITITVVSDKDGRYSFPAAKLEPGQYALSVRAVGYELDGRPSVDVAQDKAASLDLKLRKTRKLSSQLSNAEWILSAPGTPQQKLVFYNCVSCHTVERIVKSNHDAAGFVEVLKRMSGYANQSTPLHPQRRIAQRLLEERGEQREAAFRQRAEYLATINLSEGTTWEYPLKTLPRPTGRATRVIITEYDLPRPTIEPHDVILDKDGTPWYSNFGEQTFGKIDPKTGKHTEYKVDELKKGWPTGMLGLRADRDGNMWLGMMYQGAIAKFNPKTETFQYWSLPPEMNKDMTQVNMVRAESAHVDGKVWSQNNGFAAVHRLDLASGRIETFEPFKASKPGETHNIYDVIPDSQNNLYFTDFAQEHIGRIDAKTGEIKLHTVPTKASAPRRGMMDAQDRLWFGQYRGNKIAMFDTKTEKFQEWEMPTPWSGPYDVALDKNGEAWTGSMMTDRISRLDPKTGEVVDYLLPRSTNIRRVFVDNSTTPVTFWVGSNHGASIIKLEPLD